MSQSHSADFLPCVSEVYTHLDISNLLTFGVAAYGAPPLALCIVCNMNSLEYDE